MKSRQRCCKDYIKLFDEYVDSELSELEYLDFKVHIQSCKECWNSFRTYNMTVTLSRKTRHLPHMTKEQIEKLCSMLCTKLSIKARNR